MKHQAVLIIQIIILTIFILFPEKATGLSADLYLPPSSGKVDPYFGAEFTFVKKISRKLFGPSDTSASEWCTKAKSFCEEDTGCVVYDNIDGKGVPFLKSAPKPSGFKCMVGVQDREPGRTWYYVVTVDQICVEIIIRPMTLGQVVDLIPSINKYLFDIAGKCGLEPHDYKGGGHIHIDVETAFVSTEHFFNFLTTIYNMGLWPMSPNYDNMLWWAKPPGINREGTVVEGQREAYTRILDSFRKKSRIPEGGPYIEMRHYSNRIIEKVTTGDAKGVTVKLSTIAGDDLSQQVFKSRDPNILDIYLFETRCAPEFYNEESNWEVMRTGTFELRAIAPQRTVEDFIVHLKFLSGILKYTSYLEDLIPYDPPPIEWDEYPSGDSGRLKSECAGEIARRYNILLGEVKEKGDIDERDIAVLKGYMPQQLAELMP